MCECAAPGQYPVPRLWDADSGLGLRVWSAGFTGFWFGGHMPTNCLMVVGGSLSSVGFRIQNVATRTLGGLGRPCSLSPKSLFWTQAIVFRFGILLYRAPRLRVWSPRSS